MTKEGLESMIFRARDFLVSKQTIDGYWRDYHLEIGSSRAWTTAYVAYSLLPYRTENKIYNSISKAIKALKRIKHSKGWGYNLISEVDADSTAWVLRVLHAMDPSREHKSEIDLLKIFLTNDGSVRTFADSKFGTWNDEHIDVGALVGLTYLESGFEYKYHQQIVNRIIGDYVKGIKLRAFWWESDLYVWSKILELMSKTGCSNSICQEMAVEFINSESVVSTNFERALYLDAKYFAHKMVQKKWDNQVTNKLLSQIKNDQKQNGSWGSSAEMIIPSQDGSNRHIEAVLDTEQLITTATVITSLSRYTQTQM